MSPLTARQQAILDFIRSCTREERKPPSVRDIGRRFDIASPNGVLCHLKALERKGAVRKDGGGARWPARDPNTSLPLLGRIS